MNTETKTCSKCGIQKFITEFPLKNSWCKQCHSEYARKWYVKHCEQVKASANKWYAEHPEQKKVSRAKWLQTPQGKISSKNSLHNRRARQWFSVGQIPAKKSFIGIQ
jgi:hypothetical protein